MTPDAAETGRNADRTADVGAELDRHHAGGHRRRRAAGGAAGRAQRVGRVVGAAIDRIVALPVGEERRHVGLAENHRPGRLQPPNHHGVLVGRPALESLHAPGGRQAGDVERLLDGHRHAEQRRALAARQPGVGLRGGGERPVEVAHHHGVDRRVHRLDPLDRRPRQIGGAHLARRKRRRQLAGGRGRIVVEDAGGHRLLPIG